MKKERSRPTFQKHTILPLVVSFLVGAFLLSVFSAFQKLLMHEVGLILNLRSYLVPVVYGGITGLILGLWYMRLKQKERELLEAYNTTLKGWAKAVEIRDKNTQDHTERVVLLTEKLARAMGVPEKDLVHMRRGALLHDIGKIGVPDAILGKPGALTDEEWAIMQRHPARAREMLEDVDFLRPAIAIPCCHHERWDGSGYPKGTKGEDIPLAARIFAVIDVWDALVNDRPYRKAWSPEDAIAYIKKSSGTLFDPKVVEVFSANIDQLREQYPEIDEKLQVDG